MSINQGAKVVPSTSKRLYLLPRLGRIIQVMKIKSSDNIDEYIGGFPEDVQEKLGKIREIVQTAAPKATEKISYGIPTFYLNGNLVHFAAYEKHIGFYPGSSPISEFASDLEGYETSKGTIRFPLDKPLPLELIRKIVLAGVKRNSQNKK